MSGGQLEPVEHHQAHAAAAYYTSPWGKTAEKVLVLTCDGSGDRLSATVSIGENGGITRLAQMSEHDSIGRLYALVTHWLGMCPLEHEYKVMGLAPYAAIRAGRESWRALLKHCSISLATGSAGGGAGGSVDVCGLRIPKTPA